MLRIMKGYDEYNTILLPPRQPGEKLPQEVTDAYDEQQRKKEAEEKEKAEAAAAAAQLEKTEGDESGEAGAPLVISTEPLAAREEGTKAGSDLGEGTKDGKRHDGRGISCAGYENSSCFGGTHLGSPHHTTYVHGVYNSCSGERGTARVR